MSEENVAEETQATEATETQATETTETLVESTWKWNSELPGTGDAPEWLNTAKYADVSEQAKAYKELESRFGGFTGAPDEYKAEIPDSVVLPEGAEIEFTKDDPIFQAIAPVAKELNMSQEALDKMLGAYFGATVEQLQAQQMTDKEYVEKELNSIPQGVQRINQMNSWAKANLSEDEYEAFADAIVDARTALMFEKMINKTRNAPLPTPTEAQTKAYSKEDIDAAFKEKDADGNNKYITDPAHRAKVQRMMQQTR